MKKNISKTSLFSFLILSFALFNSNLSKAQVAHTWSIGAEIGPSFSKYGMDAKNHEFKAGFIAGGFLTYSIINHFGVTLKALYSQKGTSMVSNGVSVKETLNYLEIPVLGRFFLNEEGRFRPNLFVGPSFGLLLGVKNKKGEGESVAIPAAQRNQFTDLDLGLTGGIGLNYEIIDMTRLLLDARYTHGLSDIKNPGTINNKALGVTLGVSVGF